MKENQKFPEAIITPTTKAEMGLHDEDISKEEILKQDVYKRQNHDHRIRDSIHGCDTTNLSIHISSPLSLKHRRQVIHTFQL